MKKHRKNSQSRKTGREYWKSLSACLKCGQVADRYAVYCGHCGVLAENNPRLYFAHLPGRIYGHTSIFTRRITIDPRARRRVRAFFIKHEVLHVRGIDRAARLPAWLRAIYSLFYHYLYVDTIHYFFFAFSRQGAFTGWKQKALLSFKMGLIFLVSPLILLNIASFLINVI